MKKTIQFPIWYYALSIFFAWSSIILILLFWNIMTEKKGTLEAARIQARSAYEKDVLYRRWNTGHGGVYAPITKETTSNLYLDIPERDIQTPDGTRLTKINPAYMTRQVHEMAEKIYGVKGHITSLNPIRPENKPDDWEADALKAFERGKKEISSAEILDGEAYMRLMRPLLTEKQCLKCHADQGYKLGDIRGGISVAVPLSPLKAVEQKHIFTLYVIYGLLWLIGMIGMIIGFFILNRQIHNQMEIQKKLRHKEKMQGVIEMAGAACHELNQPLQVVSAASEIIKLNMKKNEPVHKELKLLSDHIQKMGFITRKLMQITRYKTKKYLNGNIIDIDEASGFKIKKAMEKKLTG